MGLFTSSYMSALESEVGQMLQRFKISTIDELKDRAVEKTYDDTSNIDYFIDGKLALTVIFDELKSSKGFKLSVPIPVDFIRHYENEVN